MGDEMDNDIAKQQDVPLVYGELDDADEWDYEAPVYSSMNEKKRIKK